MFANVVHHPHDRPGVSDVIAFTMNHTWTHVEKSIKCQSCNKTRFAFNHNLIGVKFNVSKDVQKAFGAGAVFN